MGRKMHSIACANCGKPGEVPFIPKENRPVFCKICYEDKKKRDF
ncbi:CxxC-x17-CxxC domain-containing protein [Thermoproteota archaeon]